MTIAVAHRGDPVEHRENTLPAFESAVRKGAGMIELDCRLTSDRRVVVLHDRTLTRLWGVRKPVGSLSLAELSSVGDDRYRVPQLGEVLDAVGVEVMVDVGDPDVMACAHAEVVRAGAHERCIFVGNLRGLEWLRAHDADARIGLTWPRRRRPTERLLAELRPELFNPRYDLLSAEVIAAMHGRGHGVSAWTVDDSGDMARLLDQGVDAIITNRIVQLVELLGSRRAAAGA